MMYILSVEGMTNKGNNMNAKLTKLTDNVTKANEAIDSYFEARIRAFTEKYSVAYVSGMGSYLWHFNDPVKVQYTCGEIEDLDGKSFTDDDSVEYYGNEIITEIHNEFLAICNEAEDMENACGYQKMFALQIGDIDNSIRYTKGFEVEKILYSDHEA